MPQFFPGAAVSPFKYTEASQMQQYYKMEKKIACGAEFLITQVGWDWRKSLELFTYLQGGRPDRAGVRQRVSAQHADAGPASDARRQAARLLRQ